MATARAALAVASRLAPCPPTAMTPLSCALSLSLLAALVSAKQTPVLADDKQLKYSAGNWKTGTPCVYTRDGQLEPGHPGCFNLGREACAASFQYTDAPGAAVTLTFKGTGIALATLSQPAGVPTNITVTLDGEDTSYTSEVVKAALTCQAAAFQRDGLDKDAEHTISVKTPGGAASPEDTDRPFLAIHSFTIVTGDAPDETTGAEPDPTSTTPPNAAAAPGRAGSGAIFAALIAFAAFA